MQPIHVGHYKLALGLQGFALSLPGFLDSNMLVSAMLNSHVRGIAKHEAPMQGGWRCNGK